MNDIMILKNIIINIKIQKKEDKMSAIKIRCNILNLIFFYLCYQFIFLCYKDLICFQFKKHTSLLPMFQNIVKIIKNIFLLDIYKKQT